jgi:predicted lipoprotein with Yx(FWY)xxD motif
MRRLALIFLAAAALAAGCGGDEGNGGGETRTPPPEPTTKSDKPGSKPKPRAGATVKLVGSQFGRILGDGRGQAYYLFDRERSSRSQCYGECARAWPPVLAKGEPRAGRGARGALLGTTRRRDGKLQVTYRGRPLYYYVDDGPGRVLCHNVEEFGGLWLVVRADGNPVS